MSNKLRLTVIKQRLQNEIDEVDTEEYLRLEDVSWLVKQVEELQEELNKWVTEFMI
jgi:hypothetical protein